MGQLVEASMAAASSSNSAPNSLHVYLPPGGKEAGGGQGKAKEGKDGKDAANDGNNNGGGGGSSSTLLKKLICQLCKNAIADNPKSVGIRESPHLFAFPSTNALER